jgi:hypothetical protein
MDVSATKVSTVQPTQRPTQIQQAEQKADAQARQSAPDVKKAEPPPPTPVVNTQGQTTGRLLNVTA